MNLDAIDVSPILDLCHSFVNYNFIMTVSSMAGT